MKARKSMGWRGDIFSLPFPDALKRTKLSFKALLFDEVRSQEDNSLVWNEIRTERTATIARILNKRHSRRELRELEPRGREYCIEKKLFFTFAVWVRWKRGKRDLWIGMVRVRLWGTTFSVSKVLCFLAVHLELLRVVAAIKLRSFYIWCFFANVSYWLVEQCTLGCDVSTFIKV